MKKINILVCFLLVSVGLFVVATRMAQAVASTITEASAPTEVLPSAVVSAKGGAVLATTTFSLVQASGSATLNSITVKITDPNTSGLSNTDIASVALYKENGTTAGFQAAEDTAVAGASAANPAVNGSAITLTPTTPESIGTTPVQYYIVVTIAASPQNGKSLAVSLDANYGKDNSLNTVGTALAATKKIVTDITPPADPTAANFMFIQNAPGQQDQLAAGSGISVGTSGDTVKVYAVDGTTLLGQATLGGSPVQFTPVNVGDNTNASVKISFTDPAGNESNKVQVDGNTITAPTVTSATAFSDRIVLQFSRQMDGMMAQNCANYKVGGFAITCGGPGNPFVDFNGNKLSIRGLNLSGNTTLEIPTGNTLTDAAGRNPLSSYSSGALTVNILAVPTILSLSARSGAVGDSITITGSNFGTISGGASIGDSNHKVFFSGGFSQSTGPKPPVEADYTGATWSNTSIVVKVPAGAQGGPVNVMVNGLLSDMNQNSFFDIAGNFTAKVYYSADTTTPMPDADASNIRIIIAGMGGLVTHYVGDGTTTYANGTPGIFTITGVSSMGGVWAYDVTGARLNSNQGQVSLSSTQSFNMLPSRAKISGTITLGSPCSTGTNKNIVVMANPVTADTASASFKPMNPAFFKTGADCTVAYNLGVPLDGTYTVEAHIPPDPGSTTVSSAAFTDPSALTVNISGADATGKNLTFSTANYRIVGTVQKAAGSFSSDERGMLFVYGYRPRDGGKGTGTQVNPDGSFTLYVTPGVWKLGVSGGNMPSSVETEVDVDSTYAIGSPAKGPTLVIKPQTSFIEGYVKDSAANGLSNVSLYAFADGIQGGGNATTDSQGYYKMYVSPGTGYHVGANSQSYGFLGEQTGITVSGSSNPTVNFTVSSTNNFTISGTVTKNAQALQQAFVFITSGEHGQMMGSGGTNASGSYSARVSGGSNYYLHVGLPGKGEIYEEGPLSISADTTKNITIASSTIKVRISPASSFDQAFVGVHSDTDGGFSNTPLTTATCTGTGSSCREYQIDLRRPASGSTTYFMDGGIPGYGPLPQTQITMDSSGNFTETSGTPNDGIIEITLGQFYNITGTVSGSNVTGAWVSATGPSGGNGTAVAADGSYSLPLRNGTYDITVSKPPTYIGNKVTVTVNGADVSSGTNLTLTSTDSTITGTVYLPDGSTPVVNAKVWAQGSGGGFAGASTDANGNYTLNVNSGSWTVKAAYDGYNSAGTVVTAPSTGQNITLTAVSGFSRNYINAPITPSNGGIAKGTGVKVDFPKNALGTGNTAATIEISSTTNVITTSGVKLIGTAKDITAKQGSQAITNLSSGSATVELTASKTDLSNAGITTIDQAKAMKISYYDSTANAWVEVPTVVTLSVPGAASISDLNADPAVTLDGTTTHFSSYAISTPDSGAPDTPANFAGVAGDGKVTLSWDASSGATKYDIYKKSGADYPYLAQTTSTSYNVTGLNNGTAYSFKVSALDNSDRESAATSAVTVTPNHTYVSGGGRLPQVVYAAPSIVSASPQVAASEVPTAPATSSVTMVYNFGKITLKSGSKGETVKELQKFLNAKLGISLAVDGNFGPKTLEAVKKWQKANGLADDGIVGVKTRTKMESASASVPASSSSAPSSSASYNLGTLTLKIGSRGEAVKELQKLLNMEKGTGLSVDGNFGPKTASAVKKWQKAHGLSADGIVGINTRTKMNLVSQ